MPDVDVVEDDVLRLMLMSCHPALTPESVEARQVFRVLALADWLAKVDAAGQG